MARAKREKQEGMYSAGENKTPKPRIVNSDEENDAPRKKRYETEIDEDRKMIKVKPVDPQGYKTVMRRAISMVPEETRSEVLGLLHKKEAVQFYNKLKEDEVPEDVIGTTLAYSVERLAEGKRPSIGAYLVAAGSKLMELDKKYGKVIDDAYREKIIDDKEYKSIKDRVEEKKAKMVGHARKHLSELEERVAAVWLFMTIGAILMLLSSYSITAAVVGSAFEATSLFVIGLVVFTAGIVLWIRGKALAKK